MLPESQIVPPTYQLCIQVSLVQFIVAIMWEATVHHLLAGVSNLQPVGHVQPKMAVNGAQHKIVNLFKTWWDIFVIMCHDVFNVWPKTTLLLTVWPRDAKMLDIPESYSMS